MSASEQIEKLAAFIMAEVDGEPSQSEGAGDTAIRVIKSLQSKLNQKEGKMLKTAIPYHPDDCPGCVHIYHQKDQYNVIFKCNECGDQRKLTLDDQYGFPVGLTSPANDCEIKDEPVT